MKIGLKAKAAGSVVASCALVLGIATSASAGDKVWADDYGYGEWQANPSGSIPGDAIRACDTKADGYGVIAKLSEDYDIFRTASTSGHNAGYCTGWKSGDLPEDHRYLLQIYRVKNGMEIPIDWKIVYS